MKHHRLAIALGLAALAGCGGIAQLPVAAGMGPDPTLPPPQREIIPTINIAEATGWPASAGPTAAP
jgi:hypothetical protein